MNIETTIKTYENDIKRFNRGLAQEDLEPEERIELQEGKELRESELKTLRDSANPPEIPAELTERANVTNYLSRYMGGNPVPGGSAEHELLLASGYQDTSMFIPWAAFDDGVVDEDAEALALASQPRRNVLRLADAPGSVPLTDAQRNMHSTLARVFRGGVYDYLAGGAPTMAAVGAQNYPVLAQTGITPAMAAVGTAVDSTKNTYTFKVLTPKVLQGSFQMDYPGMAIMPAWESDWRSELMKAAMDTFENQIINGNGTDPNLAGVLSHFTITAEATSDAWTSYLNKFVSGYDDVFAKDYGDIRILSGIKAKNDMATVFRNATSAGDQSIYQHIAGLGGMIRGSAHMPNGDVQSAIRSTDPDAYKAIMWPGIEIRDPYSEVGSSRVRFTYVMLVAFDLLRVGGIDGISYKTN